MGLAERLSLDRVLRTERTGGAHRVAIVLYRKKEYEVRWNGNVHRIEGKRRPRETHHDTVEAVRAIFQRWA